MSMYLSDFQWGTSPSQKGEYSRGERGTQYKGNSTIRTEKGLSKVALITHSLSVETSIRSDKGTLRRTCRIEEKRALYEKKREMLTNLMKRGVVRI